LVEPSGRRRFLARVVGGAVLGAIAAVNDPKADSRSVTLFLCGDVMTGRGIDQILPQPGNPELFEPYMRSALGYVELAERRTGPIGRRVDFAYIWGDALAELDRVRPDARIVNLETAVTASDDAWPGKGIHYRMHPANVPCIAAAKIDCCVLANNHVLDWGYSGLAETLETLRGAGIRTAGAGRDDAEAAAPAAIELPGTGRVLVFAFGHESSGVPRSWAARKDRAGVNFLADLSEQSADAAAELIRTRRRAGDLVVVSIHWGGNWGYAVPREQQAFARRLIDAGAADVVHGHSSHHPKAIEVYRERPILYGCGDFLNDYEGIRGHEAYRPDLALMYFVSLDAGSGRLAELALTPVQIRRFRVNRAAPQDAAWLETELSREGRRFGTRLERAAGGRLLVRRG
jgi:poly-gamma-glutamate synthesis protein (capsule biosynthesis protein)